MMFNSTKILTSNTSFKGCRWTVKSLTATGANQVLRKTGSWSPLIAHLRGAESFPCKVPNGVVLRLHVMWTSWSQRIGGSNQWHVVSSILVNLEILVMITYYFMWTCKVFSSTFIVFRKYPESSCEMSDWQWRHRRHHYRGTFNEPSPPSACLTDSRRVYFVLILNSWKSQSRSSSRWEEFFWESAHAIHMSFIRQVSWCTSKIIA